jgi:hypothetical protein
LASTFELTGKFPDQLFRKKNVCYVRILSRVGSADENAQGIVKIGSLFTPVIKLTHYLGEEGKYKKKGAVQFQRGGYGIDGCKSPVSTTRPSLHYK